MNPDYLTDCTQLLQAFELTQANFLRKNRQISCEEFRIEIARMKQLFIQKKNELNEKKIDRTHPYFLFSRQIERLIGFMKEFNVYLEEISISDDFQDEKIIFIFERQSKFKTIYQKHLSDFREVTLLSK